mmetsp:Transcript_55631/g.161178  ORF Transcript_55631/g.161178 Transcript_55631/m.161178 type:complete len:369 (+) Transcript_55631:107-1213(+)
MAGAALRERVLQRFGRKVESPLEQDLRRATHSDDVRLPEDAVEAIVRASHTGEEDRRKIMLHIHGCLNDSGSVWRRGHAGIVLLEALLKDGSPSLVTEAATGVHPDLSQRLGFLERYEFSYDARVEALMRRKATAVRSEWLKRQTSAIEGLCGDGQEEEAEPPRSSDVRGERGRSPPRSEPRKPSPPPPPKEVDLLNDESTTDGGESGDALDSSPMSVTPTGCVHSGKAAVPILPTVVDLLEVLAEVPQQPVGQGLVEGAQRRPPPPPPAKSESQQGMDWLRLAESHGLVESPRQPPVVDLLHGDRVPAAAPAFSTKVVGPPSAGVVQAVVAASASPANAGGWSTFMEPASAGACPTAGGTSASLLDF